MSEAMTAVVKYEGGPLELRFAACRMALGGEFAGNIDVDVDCASARVEALTELLSVQLPGAEPAGSAVGWGERAGGVELGFWCEEATKLRELPERLALLWEGAPIGEIEPQLHESVPVERVVSPRQASELGPPPSVLVGSSQVELVANREHWWWFMVAAVVAASACFGPALLSFEILEPVWVALLGAGAAAIAVSGIRLARVPYRRLWLDRDRRQLFVLEGRTSRPEAKLAEVAGRSLDGFDHVRLYMRWQIATDADGSDEEVWFVALEGPIRWAGSDGRVHLRSDALLVGEHRSEVAARRLAASVAHITGLQILDTGHDQTA